MISEMIHTASLVHDDVIDGSDKRRGKTTINEVWGERKVRRGHGSLLTGGFLHGLDQQASNSVPGELPYNQPDSTLVF